MPVSDQGVSSDRFQMIPRSLIFLFKDDQILLIKGAPNKKIWANKYNGIGGHVEPGENLIDAARRELIEETGLKDESLFLTGIVTIDTGEATGITLYVWKGTSPEGELVESTEGHLEWIHSDDLDKYRLVEDLPVILPLVSTKQSDDPPFLAHYYYKADKLIVKVISP